MQCINTKCTFNKLLNAITLPPNSTKLARFCKHLATNIKLLAAISEGVSGNKKSIMF